MKHVRVPRRSVVVFPELHQVFSAEGAARVLEAGGRYRWCGGAYDLWWSSAERLQIDDITDGDRLLTEPPETLTMEPKDLPAMSLIAARTLVSRVPETSALLLAAAASYRLSQQLLASEIACR